MIGFDTNKKYVLLKVRAGTCIFDTGEATAITFSDNKHELERFCRGMGYPLSPLIVINNTSTRFVITETNDYIHDVNQYLNNQYAKKSIECIPDISKTTSTNHSESSGYIDITNLKVGDEIVVPHRLYGSMKFIVIGKNHDSQGTVTILSKEILELLPFDAKEPANPNETRQKYGNNRYRYSNLLQWLNSDGRCGTTWYNKQHEYDNGPYTEDVSYNPYVARNGFLYGFSEEFKSQLADVCKWTIIPSVDNGDAEYVNNKVFLLSRNEIGLGPEVDWTQEGTIYEYFRYNNTDETRVAYPSEYCLNHAGGFDDNCFNVDNGWFYWLRTPIYLEDSQIAVVSPDGSLARNNLAYCGSIGIRPAMVIRNYK